MSTVSAADFDSFLKNQANENLVTGDLRAQINHLEEQIRRVLVNHEGFSIDRVRIGGSVGKGTAIKRESDVDCVIYFNDRDPPYLELNNEIFRVLKRHFGGRIDKIRASNVALKINFDGVKFDIVPAKNLLKGNVAAEDVAAEQYEAVAKLVRNNPRAATLFRTSIGESATKYVKDTDEFVHKIMLLCKKWNYGVNFVYVYGLSSMVEILAIRAAKRAQNRARTSNLYYNALQRFSGMIRSLPHMK